MIVHRVQGRGDRRGHPGRARAGFGVRDLLREHGRHHVRLGPHALADLRAPRQSASNADIHISVLVSLDPARRRHLRFADHGTGFHARVDLVARAIEETRIDEKHARLRGPDALLEVGARAALLVHEAHLERVARQAEHILGHREELVREGDFLGAMHLRLDDVDRLLAAVAERPRLLEIVASDEARDQRIQDTFRRGRAGAVKHARIAHEMPDIAHEHQAAPRH